jgi:succinate dehydrogenase / fumarate reductase cytochrome b subunit
MKLRSKKVLGETQAETSIPTESRIKPGIIQSLYSTLYAVFKSIFSTFISKDVSTALNKSAIFLIFFLFVHMAGNLFIFLGPESLNTYGYFLHINPLLKLIEIYLAFGFIVHSLTGCFKSFKKRNSIMKSPIKHGQLLFSSLFVVLFLVLHLYTFKFGTYYKYTINTDFNFGFLKGFVRKGTEMRDIYKLALEVFASPLKTWIYIISICIIGIHMYQGWTKTIVNNRMSLEQKHKAIALQFGHTFICFLTLGFLCSPVYVHFILLPSLSDV